MASSISAKSVLSLMIGLIIYVVLAAIPILGWVLGLVVTALGIGASWLFYRSRHKPANLQDTEAWNKFRQQVFNKPKQPIT